MDQETIHEELTALHAEYEQIEQCYGLDRLHSQNVVMLKYRFNAPQHVLDEYIHLCREGEGPNPFKFATAHGLVDKAL